MSGPKLSLLAVGALPQYSVYVYAVVNVSSSMNGSKLEKVCENLGNLIKSSPDDTLFDITLFSVNSSKIMCGVKKLINVPELMQAIVNSCGTHCIHTVLFDAWGEVINSIPQSVLDDNEVQIFVLTDSDDNGSTRYTHQSVMELTEDKITSATSAKFNFVNVGRDTNAGVISSLNMLATIQVQAITTDDSAEGIKIAMKTVHDDIMLSTIRSANRTNNKSPRVATPHPNTIKSPFENYGTSRSPKSPKLPNFMTTIRQNTTWSLGKDRPDDTNSNSTSSPTSMSTESGVFMF